MLIPVNDELRSICSRIVNEDLSLEQWGQLESDDIFETSSFTGGFDATENEFTFSYYDQQEYWFQISLELVSAISNGETPLITGRVAGT